jgi:hypothetical protein
MKSKGVTPYIQRNTMTAQANIYRYKFEDIFVEQLSRFAKIHQHDHRKDFKEAWTQWLDENEEIVSDEVRRLTTLDYKGDIIDKMFKSARYYFRKKSTEKKAPCKRRGYVSVDKDILAAMEKHINKNIKPSTGFIDFCKQEIELLEKEVMHLVELGFTDSKEILYKMKKTYKNRYFMLIKS